MSPGCRKPPRRGRISPTRQGDVICVRAMGPGEGRVEKRMPDSAEPRRKGAKATRTNDPEKTKADILAVAFKEFAERGFAGARVDEIAAQTRTSKRMIYYYRSEERRV